ncbi:MAG TPA: exopolysaccharide biosynthesis polyprenyl glycosylphosphotransferase [Ktedonobacteraceae bacterium]
MRSNPPGGQRVQRLVRQRLLAGRAQPEKRPRAIFSARRSHRRARPSRALWRALLAGGETLAIAVLFTWIYLAPDLARAPAQLLRTAGLSLCLALACWCLAARVAGARELSYAASAGQSLLCGSLAVVVFTLLLLAVLDPLSGLAAGAAVARTLTLLAVALPTVAVWRLGCTWLLLLPRFRQKAVIIGAVDRQLVRTIQQVSTLEILGYVAEADRRLLRLLAQRGLIDMVVVAVDTAQSPQLVREAIDARQFGIAVVPLAVLWESVSGKVPVEAPGDQWYSLLPVSPLASPGYALWESGLNVAFAICGLLFLLLILPLLALLISLESRGPIFYAQERLGMAGRPLRIYKFRSMRAQAEGEGDAVWASDGDPRVTRCGRFLRRTHLDELPQVLNILRGQMSLIGPRPERAAFVGDLEKSIPFYRARLAIRPGLTGWAQVQYRYASSSEDALVKLQYDLYYIKHRSFLLDIVILLKTVREVLLGRGV